MPYGIIKVDTITYTNGGSDQSITVSGLVQASSTSGDITSTGTIQAQNIIGLTTVSGATVSGNNANFSSLTAVSGIFTTQVSGGTILGPTHTGTTANFSSGVFTTRISGATITGDSGQFTNITGGGAAFTSVTGVTVTGTTANFSSGVFTTRVSGTTVTGTFFGVGTGGITFSDGTTQTGALSTANLATLTGAQTFTGGQRGSVVTVVYATGIALNLSSGNNFEITLTGNTTLQNPTNLVSGQAGVVTIIQSSGNNTMAFATGWQYPGGSGSVPSLTTSSGAVDLLVYYVKDTSSVAYRLVQNVKA
jgi:hypothetical protein